MREYESNCHPKLVAHVSQDRGQSRTAIHPNCPRTWGPAGFEAVLDILIHEKFGPHKASSAYKQTTGSMIDHREQPKTHTFPPDSLQFFVQPQIFYREIAYSNEIRPNKPAIQRASGEVSLALYTVTGYTGNNGGG